MTFATEEWVPIRSEGTRVYHEYEDPSSASSLKPTLCGLWLGAAMRREYAEGSLRPCTRCARKKAQP